MSHARRRLSMRHGYFIIGAIILAALLTACVMVITPVPVTPMETPEPLTTITPSASPAGTVVTGTLVAEEAVTGTISAVGMPAEIPHALKGREQCSKCHALDTGRTPIPASHEGWSDDVCLLCHTPPAGSAPASTPPAEASAGDCLACHGPFEKVMAGSPDFNTDSGETVKPHRYVPHDSTIVPECTNCHQPHPLPLPSLSDVQQANVNWCYSACHHQYNFTPCQACHQDNSGGG